jgi:hypothetical protein
VTPALMAVAVIVVAMAVAATVAAAGTDSPPIEARGG